jgi:hypothetical protein
MNATYETVRTWVDDAYQAKKSAGLKYADACASVGQMLGITPRRVEGIRQREAAAITVDEYDRIKAGYAKLLDAEARRLDARAALLRTRRDALR